MTTFTRQFENAQRLLMQADLTPAQGDRFQPTGFPDIGPARYTLADGTDMLLVESAQSMANRMESVIWDANSQTLVESLSGLPYVYTTLPDGTTTSSLQESHRLNSPYILGGAINGVEFAQVLKDETGYDASKPVDMASFARCVWKYDTCSLLHGLFMANVKGGRLRLSRALSSFVEARDVRPVTSGGTKSDRISPNIKGGGGNVIFGRTEFVASTIRLYFSLDLAQLRGYGLGDTAFDLLATLAAYKIRRLLDSGLRFRTACDFMAGDLVVTTPDGVEIPHLPELGKSLGELIATSTTAKSFADPPVTHLTLTAKTLKSMKDKDKKADSTDVNDNTDQTPGDPEID